MNKHARFTSNGFKLALMALAIGGAGSASAATANASSSSTVITPINISKITDLSFGGVAAGSVDGTVTLTPGGARTNSGAVLAGGSPTAAQFNVTGEGGKTYTISVTATPLTGSAGGSMTFTPIVDFSASGATTSNTGNGTLAGVGSNGAQSVFVGGILSVASTQAAGTYTGSVTANVDYN